MEEKQLSTKKSPWKYLLLIPAMLLLDIPMMFGFMYLDTWLLTPKPGEVGHPMPIISMIGYVGLTGLTIIGSLIAIILCIRQYLRNKKVND